MKKIKNRGQYYWQQWQARRSVNQARAEEAKTMTRGDYRLSHKGRYEIDQIAHQLTPAGKTARLRHRLNLAIVFLGSLIVICYLVLIYL